MALPSITSSCSSSSSSSAYCPSSPSSTSSTSLTKQNFAPSAKWSNPRWSAGSPFFSCARFTGGWTWSDICYWPCLRKIRVLCLSPKFPSSISYCHFWSPSGQKFLHFAILTNVLKQLHVHCSKVGKGSKPQFETIISTFPFGARKFCPSQFLFDPTALTNRRGSENSSTVTSLGSPLTQNFWRKSLWKAQ